MEELVESVKEEGILTALLVRPLGNGEYEIIAGHRRRHAAQLALSLIHILQGRCWLCSVLLYIRLYL